MYQAFRGKRQSWYSKNIFCSDSGPRFLRQDLLVWREKLQQMAIYVVLKTL